MKKKAFSLIELLVVIAVVGILAMLLLSAVRNVREYGNRTFCTNNLRQIGVAVHLYLDDNGSRFPWYLETGQEWYNKLESYIDDRDIFECPNYKDHVYDSQTDFSYGYNFNGLCDTTDPTNGWNINKIRNSRKCVVVTDSPDGLYIVFKNYVFPRHSGGVNILFVDGRVGWHRISEIPMDNSEAGKDWWNYPL